MKLLVIGSGGREHALAWKLAQSPRVTDILVAPGNAGTAHTAKCRNVAINVTDIAGLLKLAQDEAVALTVVGLEVPLVAGVVDTFRAAGLRIFGPTLLLPHSWKAARPTPRISWPVTASPPRTTPCIRKLMPHWPMSTKKAHRS